MFESEQRDAQSLEVSTLLGCDGLETSPALCGNCEASSALCEKNRRRSAVSKIPFFTATTTFGFASNETSAPALRDYNGASRLQADGSKSHRWF